MADEFWIETKIAHQNIIVMADPNEDVETVKREIRKRIMEIYEPMFAELEIQEEEW